MHITAYAREEEGGGIIARHFLYIGLYGFQHVT